MPQTKDEPIPGKLYALTDAPGNKAIANGNTWAESEVKNPESREENYIRISALWLSEVGNCVHVIFRDNGWKNHSDNPAETGRYMCREVYDAIPLGVIATVTDYERIAGHKLPHAPTYFYDAKK